MYEQSNDSFTSITSDELRWLDADAMILQVEESQLDNTRLAPSNNNGNYSSASRSSPTSPRARRHHYQRSTKSSSAKAVNRLSGSFNRRHSRSNLGYIVTPSVSTSSSLPTSSPKLATSASLPIKTPRLAKRSASYSSTHSGSSGSEWIYRRPKSPSASSPPRASAVKYARRTASDSTPSTADSSRCVTPTSTTYRSGLAASYFPDVSTSFLNVSSSSLPSHRVNSSRDANVNVNGSGSSIGSIGSIGVLVPSSFGFSSSVSSLSRQPSSSSPSKVSSTNGKSNTFWTSFLHPRAEPGSSTTSNTSSSGSRIVRLTLGKSKANQQPQPSSPLVIHSTTAIPSIWSGADLESANGTTPKRRKGRGSLKELGISRIPVSTTGSKSPISPVSLTPPVYGTPVKRRASHNSSGSISSTSSTTSSAAFSSSLSSLSSSSPPLTPVSPTSPGFGSNNKSKKFQPKFEPHHRAIVEVVEDDDMSQMDVQRRKSPSPTKSILASRIPELEAPDTLSDSLGRKKKRKDSLSASVGSNKSVKFVEKPTVHYASAIYESWDGTTGAGPFDYDMGIDIGEMDMDTTNDDLSEETAQPHTYDMHSHPYAASDLNLSTGDDLDLAAEDAVSPLLKDFNSRLTQTRALRAAQEQTQREDTCVTPTPDRGRERTSSTGTLRSLSSLKRKSSSASSTTGSAVKRSPSTSPSRSATPRPMISGPYALGSVSHIHPGGSPIPSDVDVKEIGLRSAPSLESFKSMRSGKSMRSLKSLPESVKSSLSLRARGMKDWFKGRVTVNAV